MTVEILNMLVGAGVCIAGSDSCDAECFDCCHDSGCYDSDDEGFAGCHDSSSGCYDSDDD